MIALYVGFNHLFSYLPTPISHPELSGLLNNHYSHWLNFRHKMPSLVQRSVKVHIKSSWILTGGLILSKQADERGAYIIGLRTCHGIKMGKGEKGGSQIRLEIAKQSQEPKNYAVHVSLLTKSSSVGSAFHGIQHQSVDKKWTYVKRTHTHLQLIMIEGRIEVKWSEVLFQSSRSPRRVSWAYAVDPTSPSMDHHFSILFHLLQVNGCVWVILKV